MSKYPRLPVEQILEMTDMYNAGGSPAAIADAYGIELLHLMEVLKEQGAVIKERRRTVFERYDEDMLDELSHMYARGDRVADICAQFSLSVNTFYHLLRELGIPTRTQSPEALSGFQVALDKAVQLYKEGFPYWKIESETGVSQQSLVRALHKRGIQMRNQIRLVKRYP